MRKFYKKGAVVPRFIVRTWDKKDQKHIKFSADCCVTLKKVVSLRKSYIRIEFGTKIPRRRAQPRKDWRARMNNVHFGGRYCEYSIMIHKYA